MVVGGEATCLKQRQHSGPGFIEEHDELTKYRMLCCVLVCPIRPHRGRLSSVISNPRQLLMTLSLLCTAEARGQQVNWRSIKIGRSFRSRHTLLASDNLSQRLVMHNLHQIPFVQERCSQEAMACARTHACASRRAVLALACAACTHKIRALAHIYTAKKDKCKILK
jgi:hypothetical protein